MADAVSEAVVLIVVDEVVLHPMALTLHQMHSGVTPPGQFAIVDA